jgi:hypothetical protein
VLGNNKFAYQTSCDDDVVTEQETGAYKRESNGLLVGLSLISMELPKQAEHMGTSSQTLRKKSKWIRQWRRSKKYSGSVA